MRAIGYFFSCGLMSFVRDKASWIAWRGVFSVFFTKTRKITARSKPFSSMSRAILASRARMSSGSASTSASAVSFRVSTVQLENQLYQKRYKGLGLGESRAGARALSCVTVA
jgi:hypothetical protein